ncbi:MAG: isoprenylcysteine carboxylmethyltransferase family protein, partial [bacterium]
QLFAAGLSLVILGEAVRVWASGILRKTATLAVSGPYASTRNPLYAGSFLMAAGFCIMATDFGRWHLTMGIWLLVMAGFAGVYKTQVSSEENHLADIFGAEYKEYCRRVPRYFPVFSLLGEAFRTTSFSAEAFLKNREWNAVLGTAAVSAFLAARLLYGF